MKDAVRATHLHVGSPMSETSDALAVPVDVMMRRPTLFGVPAMPILAAPLVVRRAQVEEAGALAALLVAIPLYLQLGFEPLVRGDPERELWERVIRLLSGEAGGGRISCPPKPGPSSKTKTYSQMATRSDLLSDKPLERPGMNASWLTGAASTGRSAPSR
jgi:hypothetical protein